jgi:hypothetical protein
MHIYIMIFGKRKHVCIHPCGYALRMHSHMSSLASSYRALCLCIQIQLYVYAYAYTHIIYPSWHAPSKKIPRIVSMQLSTAIYIYIYIYIAIGSLVSISEMESPSSVQIYQVSSRVQMHAHIFAHIYAL